MVEGLNTGATAAQSVFICRRSVEDESVKKIVKKIVKKYIANT